MDETELGSLKRVKACVSPTPNSYPKVAEPIKGTGDRHTLQQLDILGYKHGLKGGHVQIVALFLAYLSEAY